MHSFLNTQPQKVNIKKLENLFLNSLEYIYDAYILFTQNMPFQYSKEDDINDEFCKYLDEAVKGKGITFQPQFYNPSARSTSGRASKVDFKILWSNEILYKDYQFYVECKLLKCNGKNLAYINNGINRYKTNFYSKSLPFAAMVGYIEKGETRTIVNHLNTKVCNEELIQLKTGNIFWKSNHSRTNNTSIDLYHVLLDFRDCQNKSFHHKSCPGTKLFKSELF